MSDFMNGPEYLPAYLVGKPSCCEAAYQAPKVDYIIGELKKQRDQARAELAEARADAATAGRLARDCQAMQAERDLLAEKVGAAVEVIATFERELAEAREQRDELRGKVERLRARRLDRICQFCAPQARPGRDRPVDPGGVVYHLPDGSTVTIEPAD